MLLNDSKTAPLPTSEVIVETGTSSWTWTPEGGSAITETHTFTFYYSNNDARLFMGGTETIDGVTTTYSGDASGNRVAGAASFSTTGLPTVATDSGMAHSLFPSAKYTEETYPGWNGETETERTFIDGRGNKLGSSHTYVDVWSASDGASIRYTSTSFENQKADGTME